MECVCSFVNLKMLFYKIFSGRINQMKLSPVLGYPSVCSVASITKCISNLRSIEPYFGLILYFKKNYFPSDLFKICVMIQDVFCHCTKLLFQKLYTVCDIAMNIIMSKSTTYSLESPKDPVLPARYFTQPDKVYLKVCFIKLCWN